MAGLRQRENRPVPTDLISKVVTADIRAHVEKGVDQLKELTQGSPAHREPTPEPAAKAPEPTEQPRPPAETPEPKTQADGDGQRAQERIQQLVAERNAEREASRKETEELRRELAEANSKAAEAEQIKAAEEALAEENLPDGFYDWSQARQMAYVVRTMNGATSKPTEKVSANPKMESILLREEIMDANPDLTRTQAAAVVGIAEAYPDMPHEDALMHARVKQPELFGGTGEPTEALPASQSSQRPRGAAAQPPRPDAKRDARGRFVEAVKDGRKVSVHQAGADLVKSMVFGQ